VKFIVSMALAALAYTGCGTIESQAGISPHGPDAPTQCWWEGTPPKRCCMDAYGNRDCWL